MAAQKNSKAPKKQGPDWRWIFTIFFITVLISAVMSLISTNLLSSATLGVSFVILISIIAIGIVFDIIGVAVTAADEKPFHSMASRKVPTVSVPCAEISKQTFRYFFSISMCACRPPYPEKCAQTSFKRGIASDKATISGMVVG